jgi:leader peptidase (prepilin peptidase)/N-methyltransferase
MAITAIILGAIFGSFLSVCIYRIPYGRVPETLDGSEQPEVSSENDIAKPETIDQAKISLNNPRRSFCPSCSKQLYWYHNIPVLSWLLLRGSCAFCKAKISARYPVVELLSVLFAYLSWAQFGSTPTAALIYVFCATLIVISFIDYDYYIIPNVISLPGTVIAFGLAAINQFFGIFAAPIVPDLVSAFWGVMAGAGFLFVVSEVYLRLRKKEGLGMGDVKLLAMTGALFGVPGALYTIFLGSFLGSVIGLLLIVIFGRRMSQQLPFGPYLALGTILSIFIGPDRIADILATVIGLR